MASILVRTICPQPPHDHYEILSILVLLSAKLFDNMMRFILFFFIFYVVRSKCQQQPDIHVIDNLEVFNREDPDGDNVPRRKRLNENWSTPFCGATALRLNMSLPKVYGKWYPVQASKMAYQLWVTSLYGEGVTAAVICPIWNLQPGTEINTLSIKVSHRKKSITLEAFLLGEGFHSKSSKWVVSWPNGEDTLTSVVAVGSFKGNNNSYDWMLTMDCDLSGVVSSDWAVFSRKTTISPESLAAITAIAHGIEGLQTIEIIKTGESCDV